MIFTTFNNRYRPNALHVIDVQQQKVVQSIELSIRPFSVSISPDGNRFVASLDRGLSFFCIVTHMTAHRGVTFCIMMQYSLFNAYVNDD
jgi:hypothetical protein